MGTGTPSLSLQYPNTEARSQFLFLQDKVVKRYFHCKKIAVPTDIKQRSICIPVCISASSSRDFTP